MEPAVPFPLLGVVQILALAGWLGLAATAVHPRLRRRGTPLFVVGALLLAVAEAVTAVRIGDPTSVLVPVLRVLGFALLAVGAFDRVPQPVRSFGLVAPLGAALPLAGLVTLSAAAAAVASLRGWRRQRAVAVALGLATGLAALAAAFAAAARTGSGGAETELVLRGLSALAALAVPVAYARYSVLVKVVGGILAGIVVMAAGAVGAVGTAVADSVTSQQVAQTTSAAAGQRDALGQIETQAVQQARLTVACRLENTCAAVIPTFATEPDFFAAVVARRSAAQQVAGDRSLPPAARSQLAGDPAVLAVLGGGPTAIGGAASLTVLPTTPPALTALGVFGHFPSTRPGAVADFAAVYGVPFTAVLARQAAVQTSYDVTVLFDGQVLASSLSPGQQARLLQEAAAAGVGSGPLSATTGTTVVGQGDDPTVHFLPLDAGNGQQVAVLAVSLPGGRLTAAERSVLSRLFLTAVLVLLVAAAFAAVVGRRIVDPVRRLTAAAGRVRRGDLAARSGLAGRDEVGMLARAFDEMTSSLQGVTGELRTAAQAEAELRARLQTVLDSMGDGLVTTSADRRVTTVNPAAARLLATTEKKCVGRSLADVLDVRGDDGTPVLPAANAECDGWLGRDGGPVPVRVAASALRGPAAEAGGLVVVLRDMTRDREVERMKTEFLSNVSHELRTPLTPIRGYAELLLRRDDLTPAQVAGYIGEISESSRRMQRVVDLLVDVAALEAGRVQPNRRLVPVADLLDSSLRRWRTRWPERADKLHAEPTAELPDVSIDPDWVAKALDELALNAVTHTPQGTEVTLRAAALPGGRRVRVSLRDSGPGVPADQLPALLADFSQADASATRRVGGLGLGLAFVRRLADAFDLGHFAESRPGQGAEFGLDLPAGKPAAPRQRGRLLRRAAPATARSGRRRTAPS